jgi:hypothetical protein
MSGTDDDGDMSAVLVTGERELSIEIRCFRLRKKPGGCSSSRVSLVIASLSSGIDGC